MVTARTARPASPANTEKMRQFQASAPTMPATHKIIICHDNQPLPTIYGSPSQTRIALLLLSIASRQNIVRGERRQEAPNNFLDTKKKRILLLTPPLSVIPMPHRTASLPLPLPLPCAPNTLPSILDNMTKNGHHDLHSIADLLRYILRYKKRCNTPKIGSKNIAFRIPCHIAVSPKQHNKRAPPKASHNGKPEFIKEKREKKNITIEIFARR